MILFAIVVPKHFLDKKKLNALFSGSWTQVAVNRVCPTKKGLYVSDSILRSLFYRIVVEMQRP